MHADFDRMDHINGMRGCKKLYRFTRYDVGKQSVFVSFPMFPSHAPLSLVSMCIEIYLVNEKWQDSYEEM